MFAIFSQILFSRYSKTLILVIDLVVLNTAILFALFLTNNSIQFPVDDNVNTFFKLSNLFWVIFIISLNVYGLNRIETTIKVMNAYIILFFAHSLTLLILLLILKYTSIFYFILFYSEIIIVIGIFLSRYILLTILKHLRTKRYNTKTIAIYGYNQFGNQIAEYMLKNALLDIRLLGYYDENKSNVVLQDPYLGDISQFCDNVKLNHIDELFICMEHINNEVFQRLVTLCDKNMIRIKYVLNLHQFTQANRLRVEFYDSMTVINLRSESLLDPFNYLFKRGFDILFSLLVILLIFPWLFPIIYFAIKFSSRGPCFFVQLRSGKDNTSFKCYKFRTMYVNDLSDSMQAHKSDLRITRVGSFLRRTNLDELPQFFNVLNGSMSVVGPRPHMLNHTKKYKELMSNYLVRHFIRPGITGWAQVNGYRGETKEILEMQNRVNHDIYYLENWSFLFDIKIIFMTVKNMVNGEDKAF